MTDRLRCCCPGCRRTKPAGEFAEWICARHWAAVPRRLRVRYSRLKRRARRDPRWCSVAARMWIRCRSIAETEALMGMNF